MDQNISRRHFLGQSGIASSGLLLSFCLPGKIYVTSAATDFAPNAFLQIKATGEIVIYGKNPEIGQGVKDRPPDDHCGRIGCLVESG